MFVILAQLNAQSSSILISSINFRLNVVELPRSDTCIERRAGGGMATLPVYLPSLNLPRPTNATPPPPRTAY
jgi:hypothetical protein